MTTTTAQACANIAFIKYSDGTQCRTDGKDNFDPKTLAERLFTQVFLRYLASQ
jgi:hypothetical protein